VRRNYAVQNFIQSRGPGTSVTLRQIDAPELTWHT